MSQQRPDVARPRAPPPNRTSRPRRFAARGVGLPSSGTGTLAPSSSSTRSTPWYRSLPLECPTVRAAHIIWLVKKTLERRQTFGRRGWRETPSPTAPEAAQQDPEEPVGRPDDGASSTGQGAKLLAEDQVLNHEVASRAQGRAKSRQEEHSEERYRAGEEFRLRLRPGTHFRRAAGGSMSAEPAIRRSSNWEACSHEQ